MVWESQLFGKTENNCKQVANIRATYLKVVRSRLVNYKIFGQIQEQIQLLPIL